jgi:hypothetical protein
MPKLESPIVSRFAGALLGTIAAFPIAAYGDDQALYSQRRPMVGQTASNPKVDCEAVMQAAVPFARQMLGTHGEFYPFGAAMQLDGKIVSVAAYEGNNDRPQASDLIHFLKQALGAAARQEQYRATAIVYDARVKLASTGELTDAINVLLDHRDNYSVVVVIPYSIASGKLVLGTAFAHKGEADIFRHDRCGRQIIDQLSRPKRKDAV